MKSTIAVLIAVAVLAGVSARAEAAGEGYRTYEGKHRYVQKKYRRSHSQPQYWAERLPYGSQSWWQQMDREGRGGRRP
jgi:hypothetical protein